MLDSFCQNELEGKEILIARTWYAQAFIDQALGGPSPFCLEPYDAARSRRVCNHQQ